MIVPERLRQIRLARGYTMDQLVDRMGGMVEKQSLSNYEKGKHQPRPGVLLQLARALQVKPSELSGSLPVVVEFLGYRRSSGMTKKDSDTLESRISFNLEKRVRLHEIVDRGANNSFRFEPVQVSTLQDAENAALIIRNRMGLGSDAIGNLTETLELHGIHVFALDNTPEKFHGISAVVKKDDRIVSAGIADRIGMCGERQRLTRAHEAGHIFTSIEPGLDTEKVAYRFAGAFLIPAETLVKEVGKKRKALSMAELLTLKKRYGISVAALLKRLLDLDIVTLPHYEMWQKKRNREGWRNDEPEPCEPEASSWLRQNVLRAHAEGLLTTREAEEMIGEKIGNELPALTRLRALKQLSKEEQRRILEKESQAIASLYCEDLSKTPHERELTAFTALDGVDPLIDDEE